MGHQYKIDGRQRKLPLLSVNIEHSTHGSIEHSKESLDTRFAKQAQNLLKANDNTISADFRPHDACVTDKDESPSMSPIKMLEPVRGS